MPNHTYPVTLFVCLFAPCRRLSACASIDRDGHVLGVMPHCLGGGGRARLGMGEIACQCGLVLHVIWGNGLEVVELIGAQY